MTTSEDSDLLNYIKSRVSTKNICDEQLEVFKYLPSLIYSFDLLLGKLTLYNPQHFFSTLGFTSDEVDSWEDIIPNLIFVDDQSALIQEIEKFRLPAGNAGCCYDCRMNHKEGHFRNFNTQATVLKQDNSGLASSLLFVSEDITEKTSSKAAIAMLQKAVADSEQLLQSGSWNWNLASGSVACSDGMLSLLGYEKEKIDGPLSIDFILSHITKDDLAMVQRVLKEAVADKRAFECSFSVLTNDMKVRMMSSTAKMVVNEKGEVVEVLGINRDISKDINVRNHLRDYGELTLEKEEFLNQGSWQWDSKHNITVWSAGMYRLFGYSIPGKTNGVDITATLLQLHLQAEDKAGEQKDWLALFNGNKNYIGEISAMDSRGVCKQLETFARIINDPYDNSFKVIGTTRDVTRLRNYEKTLEEKVEALNRSNKELEEFAYIASHDLQEPLRKLTHFSERLQAKFHDKLGKDGTNYLERIGVATDNMRLLIQNLLEFSRSASSSEHFSVQNLNNLLLNVKGDLELKIEETGASIIHDVLPSLEVIPSQIKQLFDNLLSNAIKFRKKEEPCVISISHHPLDYQEKDRLHLPVDENYFKIVIQDNGIGFEKEYADRIFQIFQRLHGKSEYPGSGIGLAICKKIAENHKGIIYAESVHGSGAMFTMILPERQTSKKHECCQ